MSRWSTGWQLIKDIALTGTGLLLIVLQVFAKHPSDTLLVVGLALTVPSAASHAGALLSGPSYTAGHGGPPSSGSSSPHGPPPASSPSSPELTDERPK